jgi:glycosyltransferase involved in cell wall biosynthesis
LAARRQVITIHDLAALDHPEWFSARLSLLSKLMMPALIRRALHVLTVSDYTKERIVRTLAIDERKITVIPNGVEARFRPQPAHDIGRVTKALGIPQGPYLLSVCSLEPRKNLARLLAAWSILNAKGVQATLVLAGAKGSTSVFKADCLGPIPDRVMFTGYVADEDLPALYSGASALVYPSLYEGFGLPILEAHASGTRVIAANTTSMPEVAGPSAFLVDPMSTHEMAAAMEKALTQSLDLAALSSGFEHAGRFTWDTCARKTEQLLLSNS